MTNEIPARYHRNKTLRELTIQWKDGHTSVYPFGLLRAACPCASCRGGHENMRSEPDPEVFQHQLEDSCSYSPGEHRSRWAVCHHHRVGRWASLRDLQLAFPARVMPLRGVPAN